MIRFVVFYSTQSKKRVVGVFETDNAFIKPDTGELRIWVGGDGWVFTIGEDEIGSVLSQLVDGKDVIIVHGAALNRVVG